MEDGEALSAALRADSKLARCCREGRDFSFAECWQSPGDTVPQEFTHLNGTKARCGDSVTKTLPTIRAPHVQRFPVGVLRTKIRMSSSTFSELVFESPISTQNLLLACAATTMESRWNPENGPCVMHGGEPCQTVSKCSSGETLQDVPITIRIDRSTSLDSDPHEVSRRGSQARNDVTNEFEFHESWEAEVTHFLQ